MTESKNWGRARSLGVSKCPHLRRFRHECTQCLAEAFDEVLAEAKADIVARLKELLRGEASG